MRSPLKKKKESGGRGPVSARTQDRVRGVGADARPRPRRPAGVRADAGERPHGPADADQRPHRPADAGQRQRGRGVHRVREYKGSVRSLIPCPFCFCH
jgi:hypothetical protein